ncbi:low-density lipoprotein receptor-related protein 10 [Rhinatrema bivittatum]|uniref:low-density lipoprotein receptor-related protein 10 n=1 Tax=Rhinatrema bivittatum TaxID=194408 RepID=UPI0011270B57|nr:low-density lipoprotein receptor-related protein 10 [Rhinatrema bivittatum]
MTSPGRTMASRAAPCVLLLLCGSLGCARADVSFGEEACKGIPQVLTDTSGHISSPLTIHDYHFSRSCTWIIQAKIKELVSIRFDRFFIPCDSERLTIQAAGRKPVTLCGKQSPGPVQLPGGNISLVFSVSQNPSTGFQLSYFRHSPGCLSHQFQCWNDNCVPALWLCNGVDECTDGSDEAGCPLEASALSPPPPPPACNRTLDSFYGVLSSPAFGDDPSALHEGCECWWLLDPHDSSRLVLQFVTLELGYSDALRVYDESPGGRLLRGLDFLSNGQKITVESFGSKVAVFYRAGRGGSRGFNATYHVLGYCLPWDTPCGGGEGGCFTDAQRCDNSWDCEGGQDERGCGGCPGDHYPCGGGRGGGSSCYTLADRCNYQASCADGADERHCRTCQPGSFRCEDEHCIYESWVCDGQADCADGSDERSCGYQPPRKVVTAAVVGSLVCGLLLVVALGCTCKLYAIRTQEYSIFAPLSRTDAEFIQRQAPPSYGQLIAQGAIPPVEDFPTENAGDNSVLGNLRSLLQILRQDQARGLPARRRHRSRHLRRFLRRLRRWGLLPSATAATAVSSSPPEGGDGCGGGSTGREPTAASAESEGAEDGEGATGGSESAVAPEAPPLPRKVPLLSPHAGANANLMPRAEAGNPAPPGNECAPSSLGTVLSGVVQTLRGRFFSQRQEWGVRGDAEAPSQPRSGGEEDDDEVLLLPLAEGWAEMLPERPGMAGEWNTPSPANLSVNHDDDDDDDDAMLLPC